MTAQELANILLQVPEFKPRSVALLERRRAETGELWPHIRPLERQQALREVQQLSKAANIFASKLLKNLKPIPIQSANHLAVRSVFL